MSKGDKPRPMNVTYNEYVDNWEKAFGEKEKRIFKIEIGDIDSEEVDELVKNIGKQIKGEVDEEITEDALGRESKSNMTLLNDNTLDAQLEKVKSK
jgi:hypothetical protein